MARSLTQSNPALYNFWEPLSDTKCAQWAAFESEVGRGDLVAKEQRGSEWIVVDRSSDRLLHIHVSFSQHFNALC